MRLSKSKTPLNYLSIDATIMTMCQLLTTLQYFFKQVITNFCKKIHENFLKNYTSENQFKKCLMFDKKI